LRTEPKRHNFATRGGHGAVLNGWLKDFTVTGGQASMNEATRAEAPRMRVRAFSQARRHSRFVRFFKVAIPLGAVVGIGAVGFVAFYDPFRQIQGLTLGPVSVSGTQVAMESPKLTGFRNDNRPYEVTATTALQDVRKPNIVELREMKARITMNDQGGIARLEAANGTLDTQRERMTLRDNVRVWTENGQEVKLRSASVNFKAGTVVSKEPVVVNLGNGVINASGVEVTENGKVLRFSGRVSSVFENLSEPVAGAPKAAPPEVTAPTAQAQPTSFRP
jgi:lipopolysaccharide export system protein LptC